VCVCLLCVYVCVCVAAPSGIPYRALHISLAVLADCLCCLMGQVRSVCCCSKTEVGQNELQSVFVVEHVPHSETLEAFEDLKSQHVLHDTAPADSMCNEHVARAGEEVATESIQDISVAEVKRAVTISVGPSVTAGSSNVSQVVPPSPSAALAPLDLQRHGSIPHSDVSIVTLESRLQTIKELCRTVQTLDAFDALQQLELDVAEQAKQTRSADATAALKVFSKLLASDPQLCQLRHLDTRIKKMMQVVDLVPNNREGDVRWANLTKALPEIHPNCKLEMAGRFLEEGEKNKSTGSTQFVMMVRIYNIPITLNQNVAVYTHMDLYKKQWDNCKDIRGWPGGPQKMHSVVYSKVSPGPLPFTPDTEVVCIRDFSVCAKSPLPGFAPGVLVASNPVDCLDASEGWEIPPIRPGVPRSTSSCIDYLTHGDHPTTSHLVFFLSRDVPFPQWMLPLNLGAKILSVLAEKNINSLKNHCWDCFDETGLVERMASMPDLMDRVRGLGRTVEDGL